MNAIFNCRKYCEAIVDDLLLFTPEKKSQKDKMEYLLKALLKNELKISPQRFQIVTQW